MNVGNKEAFAARLRAARKSKNITQRVVAEALGLDRSTYAYYETGKTTPDPLVLGRIASAFGLSVDELLGGFVSRPELHDSQLVLSGEDLLEFADLSVEEQVLVLQYRQLQNESKMKIRSQIEGILNE